jgi:hypothetical protein
VFVPSDYPTDDEIVLRVRYTEIKGWVRIFILILSGAFIIDTACFFMLPRAEYRRAIMCLVGGAALLGFALEVLFTKHILFCSDRVVKVWHVFGKRSIPYNMTRLDFASFLNGPRKGKVYVIKEVGTSGSVSLLQVPIFYRAYMVSPETDKQVDAVLSYLVGIEGNSAVNEKVRVFQRSTLPKEVLS